MNLIYNISAIKTKCKLEAMSLSRPTIKLDERILDMEEENDSKDKSDVVLHLTVFIKYVIHY
jgi:hypothetical protein